MKIDSFNSTKIKIISFWMIVMVLYIHNYYLEGESMSLPNAVQLFGGAITSVAVPMFYVISGFLFFLGIDSAKQCFPKIKKRAKTLLVPYLIWNVVFVLWYVVLENIPTLSVYVNSDMISKLSLGHPVDTLLFLFVKPAGFHMWFLRDLIVFVLLSPLLYVAIKRLKWLAFVIVVLATAWMTRFWLSSFVLGGIIALYYKDVYFDFFRGKTIVFIFLLFFYLTYCVLISTGVLKLGNDYLAGCFSQLFILVPIFVVWYGYDYFVSLIANRKTFSLESRKEFVPSKCFSFSTSYTFFIYLFHEPAINIIKKLGLKLLGKGDLQLIVLYLVNPVIMVSLSVAIGYLLKCFMPKLYSIAVGGR